MHFEPILDNLEPFIGRVPERSKTMIMNMGIKIPLNISNNHDFLLMLKTESHSITFI